ncbi:MAG: hypothetical protein E2O52_06440 [Gammaproteobacteria bacterium]|nr:MAG: hypothetical protein E2O52_06440 [Gammaproteobacteria bacterium]
MLAYVQVLINIALRKRGPEDLPDSGFLLGVSFAAYLLLQLPLAWLDYGRYGSPGLLFKATAVSVGILFSSVWLLLRLTGFRSRYRQTLIALVGTSALLNFISFPLSFWNVATRGMEPSTSLPGIFLFAIVLWSLSIDGHILSRALSRPYLIGLLAAIALFLLQVTMWLEMMPAPFIE